MVRFVIVRHGLSQYNKEQRYTGQKDVPLDEVGIRQAENNAAYVVRHYQIDTIYSSDLQRAVRTAQPVAETLGLPIHTEKDLREIYAGSWEGYRLAEVKEKWPEELAWWRSHTGIARCGDGDGESFQEVRERAGKVMRKIALENDGKTVLVATHGGFVRALCCEWLGVAPEDVEQVKSVGNASLTVADYDPRTGAADFLMIGYAEHLTEKAAEVVVH